MTRIEALLAKPGIFRVDPTACMLHAERIRNFQAIVHSGKWSLAPKSIQLAFKTVFISICHQFNWDFLQSALADYFFDGNVLSADVLCGLRASDVANILAEYPKKDRIRSQERARILRNIGEVIRDDFNGDWDLFYATCENSQLGTGEFHKIFDRFDGYRSDPLRKKTNVLSHDLFQEKILTFNDSKNIHPAVDYHIMRVYLRTGRVIPIDQSVFPFIQGAPNPRGTLVRALRSAVSDAEKLTAFYSGVSIPALNYLEWQIGREICLNGDPRCTLGPSKPCAEDIYQFCGDQCPYVDVCLSKTLLPSFLSFEEPNYVSTDY